jgi:flagellar hook-associated protein 2
MAEGVLGLAGGGSSALNQDVIDKLKAAERTAVVEPIENKLETWDEEFLKMAEIKASNLELIESFKNLSLNNTQNAFEQKVATTTGTAVSYDASDVSGLINGTTSISVTQLAQKDVYQTSIISDKTAQIANGNDPDDMITIQVAQAPVYQSSKTSTDTANDLVGAGEFTITPDGAGALTITTDATTTWDNLKDMINADINLTASFENGRLSIAHTDGETTLAIADTSNSNTVASDLGISRGRKFTTVGKSYEDLAADINANSKLSSSVEQVGEDEFRLVIKSANSGTANALDISQDGVSLGMSSQMKSVAATNTATQILNGDDVGDKITIDGIDFPTNSKSYELLADDINNNANFNASVVNNQIVISRVDGADLVITQTGVDLGFSSAIVSAQNLEATIDGVDYDVSSNSITTQGSLKITANELGDSSINIQQDTSSILTSVNNMVEKYNSFISLIDTELDNAESPIQDKSALRLMKSNIKDILFDNYGTTTDKNLFNVGFSLDKSGFLSIDETEFNKAISDDFDSLKELFVGTADNKGLTTLLETYTNSLDSIDGILYQYDNSMTSRKTTLDEELADEIETLDDKYSLMAEEFAAYGSLIASMEAQFGSLKLMIDQSTASS